MPVARRCSSCSPSAPARADDVYTTSTCRGPDGAPGADVGLGAGWRRADRRSVDLCAAGGALSAGPSSGERRPVQGHLDVHRAGGHADRGYALFRTARPVTGSGWSWNWSLFRDIDDEAPGSYVETLLGLRRLHRPRRRPVSDGLARRGGRRRPRGARRVRGLQSGALSRRAPHRTLMSILARGLHAARPGRPRARRHAVRGSARHPAAADRGADRLLLGVRPGQRRLPGAARGRRAGSGVAGDRRQRRALRPAVQGRGAVQAERERDALLRHVGAARRPARVAAGRHRCDRDQQRGLRAGAGAHAATSRRSASRPSRPARRRSRARFLGTRRSAVTRTSGRRDVHRQSRARAPASCVTLLSARAPQRARAAIVGRDRGHRPGRGLLARRCRPGPSRRLRAGCRASPATATLSARRRSTSACRRARRCRRTPRTVRAGSRFRLTGRLLGGRVPARGKLVDLQAHERGHWRTFGSVRTRASGASAYALPLPRERAAQTFPLRARVRPDAAYPFSLGYSRSSGSACGEHVCATCRRWTRWPRRSTRRARWRSRRRGRCSRERREELLGGARRTRPTWASGRGRGCDDVTRPSLRRVLNATGVIVHTNLGRAPLAEAAREAVARVAEGYANLELDLETGARGSRHAHVEPLLRELTGAEAGFAVNNGAGAALLAVAALGRARPRGRGLARAAGGDRRRVPRAGRDRPGGRAARRGRHDQPHAARRLRARDRRGHRRRCCACTSRTSASSGSSRTCRSRRCASSACR